MENFRQFSCGPDPFGRTWQVYFKWLQTAISIRHSDSVDVKFVLTSGDETEQKTISLPHLALLKVSKDYGVKMTDAWCARLAQQHLEHLVLSGEDMEKSLISPSVEQISQYAVREKNRESEQIQQRKRGAA